MTIRLGKRVFEAFVLFLSLGSVRGVEEAPWQRLLKGDDSRKAAELQRKINDLQGQFVYKLSRDLRIF